MIFFSLHRSQICCLGLLLTLFGCEQQIQIRRVVPIDSTGALRATAAILDQDGTIIVVGASTAVRGIDQSRLAAHPETQGDLRILPADSLSGGTGSSLGMGSIQLTLRRIEQSVPRPSRLLALTGLEDLAFSGFVSDDSGQSWRDLGGGFPGLRNRTVAGATFSQEGFYISTQLGEVREALFQRFESNVWQQLTVPISKGNPVAIRFATPGNSCLLGTAVPGLVSEDCGKSWKDYGSDVAVIQSTAADPRVPGLLYALGYGAAGTMRVLRSDDWGINWKELPFPRFSFNFNVYSRIRIDPERPNVIYCIYGPSSLPDVTPNVVWRSTDGGMRWELVKRDIPFVAAQTDFANKRHYGYLQGDQTLYVASSDFSSFDRVTLAQRIQSIPALIDGKLYLSVRPLSDVFVARFRPDGTRISYAEFGGTGNDAPDSIGIFPNGDLLISGWSQGDDLPATSRVSNDALGFVARLSPDGSQVRWLTRVPGSTRDVDEAWPVFSAVAEDGDVMVHTRAVDPAGVQIAYLRLAGADGKLQVRTRLGFRAPGPVVRWKGDEALVAGDGFVRRIDRDGRQLAEYGGQMTDVAALELLPQGGILQLGTFTGRFVIPPNPNQLLKTYGTVQRLGDEGSLVSRSYVGGSEYSTAQTGAVDPFGNILVAGLTTSRDFPLRAPLMQWESLVGEGFLMKFDGGLARRIYSTVLSGFRPVKILPLGTSRWLLVGNGLADVRPRVPSNPKETLTFLYVDEREGGLPRIDGLSRQEDPRENIGFRNFPAGTEATVAGEWARESSTVWVDAVQVAATNDGEGRLRFIVPTELQFGYHQVVVRTGQKESNALRFVVP